MRGLHFQNLRDKNDYPLLLELNRSNREADKNNQPVTLEVIADVLAHMDGLTPQQGVIIAGIPAWQNSLGRISNGLKDSTFRRFR